MDRRKCAADNAEARKATGRYALKLVLVSLEEFATRHVPLLLVEMGADSLDLHTLFEAGGNDPKSRERVLDTVSRLVDRESRGGDLILLPARGYGAFVLPGQ